MGSWGLRLAKGRAIAHLQRMDELYHPRILELAADLDEFERLAEPHGSATRVSRVCGSVVTVDVRLDGDVVEAIGIEPKACALGQASAAILAKGAVGASIDDIVAARNALRAMLKEGAPPPQGRFWELRHLLGVRGYPQRHASTLLAFEAAVDALAAARSNAAL